jgi:hypothetical protein
MYDRICGSMLVYEDSENRVRAARGLVNIHGDRVRVDSLDGRLYVPLPRVVAIELWTGEEVWP